MFGANKMLIFSVTKYFILPMIPFTKPLDLGNHFMATPRGGAYAKANPNPKQQPYVMAVKTTES